MGVFIAARIDALPNADLAAAFGKLRVLST